MNTCFVMQPFDKGTFDTRYDEIIAPAITDAGLTPYRVDRDPRVSIPIEDIQSGISNARACVADISIDNPNVWFELGFAIALQKEVVLICSRERTTHFPFDVQHRNILVYSADSLAGFAAFRAGLTNRLKGILDRHRVLGSVASIPATSTVEGLGPHELAALVTVAQRCIDPTDSVSTSTLRTDMDRTGFTEVATTIAARSLLRKGLIESATETDDFGASYAVYRPTRQGMEWLMSNQDQLVMRVQRGYGVPSVDDTPF